MEIFNIEFDSTWKFILSSFPLVIWITFLCHALFSPFEKILNSFKGKSFSFMKILLILSFLVSGPILLIIGIVIMIVRHNKLSPSQKAMLNARFKTIKEKADLIKKKTTQQVVATEFEEKLPDFLKEKITKPSSQSMKAALSSPTIKQDNGLGRAFILILMIIILSAGYYIWKSGLIANLGA